jgi:hypothetical protein
MKFSFIWLFLITILTASNPYENVYYPETNQYSLIVKDSVGVCVTYKEKYGTERTDTGTILLMGKYEYVLVKRNSSKIRYPIGNVNFIDYRKCDKEN